jgi:hypothetical protein
MADDANGSLLEFLNPCLQEEAHLIRQQEIHSERDWKLAATRRQGQVRRQQGA